ncbi:MAG: zinc-dependent alcohol dehydrogenase [Methanocella sp.]
MSGEARPDGVTMRRGVVVGPGRVEVETLDLPQVPPGWVLTRVEAMGVCGTDVEIFTGHLPYLKSGLMRYPVVPGHEWVGRVAAVGEGVKGFVPGDRVTGETHLGCGECEACLTGRYTACTAMLRVGIGGLPGACGDYVLLPAKAFHHLPADLPALQAILIEPCTVVHNALMRAGFSGGERVVIYGPGTLGLLGVSVARALGAGEVVLVGTREGRLEVGRQVGADQTVNARTEPEAAAGLSGTADVVLEATGSPEGFAAGLAALKKYGTLCVVSLYKSPAASLDLNRLVTASLRVSGSLGAPGIWEKTIRLMVGGRIRTEGIVTHRFPLDRLAEALETAHTRAGGAIKVAVEMEPSGMDETECSA